jgi:hypothetical protein
MLLQTSAGNKGGRLVIEATARETHFELLFQDSNVTRAIVDLGFVIHCNEVPVILLGGSPLDRSFFEKILHVCKEHLCARKLVDLTPSVDDMTDVPDFIIAAFEGHGPHVTKESIGLIHLVLLAERLDDFFHCLAIRHGGAISRCVIIRHHFEKLGSTGVIFARHPRRNARHVFDIVEHSSVITILGQLLEPREYLFSVVHTVSASRIGPMLM